MKINKISELEFIENPTRNILFHGMILTIPDDLRYVTIDAWGEIIAWYNKPKNDERSSQWYDDSERSAFHQDWRNLGYVELDDKDIIDDWRDSLIEVKTYEIE